MGSPEVTPEEAAEDIAKALAWWAGELRRPGGVHLMSIQQTSDRRGVYSWSGYVGQTTPGIYWSEIEVVHESGLRVRIKVEEPARMKGGRDGVY